MGPIRACVDSLLWDAVSKFPVAVFLKSPKVVVSLAILIWFGISVLNIHVGIGKQRIYIVIMEIELGRRNNWFSLMVSFAEGEGVGFFAVS